MFGLKIKNWMETHIVRPKKNKSKQKQPINGSSTDKHLCTFAGEVASLRRSEISPIQSQTRPSAGWQTPSPEIKISPFHYGNMRSKSDSPVKKLHQIPPQITICTNSNRYFHGGDFTAPSNPKVSSSTDETVSISTGKTKTSSKQDKKLNPPNKQMDCVGIISYLSSPESAYSSAGYSTDCTSPGGNSFAPESVYVNMRTGTQYIPSRIGAFNSTSEIINQPHLKYVAEKENVNTIKKDVIAIPNFQQRMESPSPRQRCRIRTNPWLNTSSVMKSPLLQVRNGQLTTEIEINNPALNSLETPSPNMPRKRKIQEYKTENKENQLRFENNSENIDDEDVTLKEMGQFDESYIYEKETDILSDSDATQCQESDLEDTGQDAEDEGDDEDEDIDFIDTGSSVPELKIEAPFRNLGSCEYYPAHEHIKTSRSSVKIRKKVVRRTRKKSLDRSYYKKTGMISSNGRESRSVGGTPLLIRKMNNNTPQPKLNDFHSSNRCNSHHNIVGHHKESAMLTIANSEKVLLKADLEAFMKYKKLIYEAESLLDTMKVCQAAPPKPDTPALINHSKFVPTNKRVEILRNCEMPKRESAPSSKFVPKPGYSNGTNNNLSQQFLINKKIELLKNEQQSMVKGNSEIPQPVPKIENHFDYYYPQSEPLKRKIYSVPNPTELKTTQELRTTNVKQQLILRTLKDLKQSLETQKIELYGLNDD